MAIKSDERYYLKLKSLHYLYDRNYTHTETAKLLGISRVTLNRLLEEAHSDGMIKINIVDTRNLKPAFDLEDSLCARFGLSEARILDAGCQNSDPLRLSIESARYVENCIHSGMKIGLAWGRALRAMINQLSPNPSIKDLDIYTILGGACSEADFQPNIMVQSLLSLYSGTGHVINAPYICHSELLCSELRKEPSIAEVLETTKKLDLAIIGIGETPLWKGFRDGYYHFSERVIDELIAAGAVGDICGNFFDISGKVCQTSITNRIVSVSLDDLKSCRKVVAIAYGESKIQSIQGAINGGYIDVLLTDTDTATSLLAQ